MLDKYIDIVNKKIEDELKEIDKIVYSNSKKAWKDKKGKKYRFLPKNSKKSIILTK